MLTVFERIPDYFVERYNEEICAWGVNLGKIGPVKTIILKEGPFSDLSPAEDQGAILLGVRLIARMEMLRDRVTVSPFNERDEEIIARHCRKMQALGVGPRLFWKEPPRPGLPFMPNIVPPDETRH
jgi:hypothetical protein